MQVVEVVAIRPLSGTDWRGKKYRADPGESFRVSEVHATRLMMRGLARKATGTMVQIADPVRVISSNPAKRPNCYFEEPPDNLLSEEAYQRNLSRIKAADTFRRDLRIAHLLAQPEDEVEEEEKTVTRYATKMVRPKTKRTKKRTKATAKK